MLLAQSAPETAASHGWDVWTLLCVILAAAGYVALQAGILRSRSLALIGVLLIAAGGVIAAFRIGNSPEELLFIAFTALATAGAVSFLVLRQPVHAALGFAITVLSACGLLFLQSAPFLAAATMVVYAGATIIIFLFVLMFAQQAVLESHDVRLSSPLASAVAAGVLLVILAHAVTDTRNIPLPVVAMDRPFSNETNSPEPSQVVGLGRALYSDYLWSVELAGTLLLVAVVGAIAIAQRAPEGQP